MYNPIATYRIQFNQSFTLKDLSSCLSYLAELGIGAVYASPIFEATPGSMHGYDVANPLNINPEIGTPREFEDISKTLHKFDMGWVQDWVPNHMAFHLNNPWITDILEKGEDSEYAAFFDIDWGHPDFDGKFMVPFLGDDASAVVDRGELKLDYRDGRFVFAYFDNLYPLSEASVRRILEFQQEEAPEVFAQLLAKAKEEKKQGKNDRDAWRVKRNKELRALYQSEDVVAKHIAILLEVFNQNTERLHGLLELQHYRLSYWKITEQSINFRRFFTINDLICLNMQRPEVFEAYHAYLSQLLEKGHIQGLRIDHIDGMYDPTGYFSQLREMAGSEAYLVVEKILEAEEELPTEWPLQGNTGYDFLVMVNNLFTYQKNYPKLLKLYKKLTGIGEHPEDIIYKKKKFILTQRMQGEWDNLFRLFEDLGLRRLAQDESLKPSQMKDTIGEFLIASPVYKLYSRRLPLSVTDQKLVASILKGIVKRRPELEKGASWLKKLLLEEHASSGENRESVLKFFTRAMQFTGPLMAKGVEDTTMYYYNCFIAHNEVGDAPDASGILPEAFHEAMKHRARFWPLTMNCTATHDTKRGEDVRARLNVISEMPKRWEREVTQWIKHNRALKKEVEGKEAPTINEEYLIYQTLLGVFPPDAKMDVDFLQRMQEYLLKAMREAKMHTSWADQNEEHEKAVLDFVRRILEPQHGFLEIFLPLQQDIASYGAFNSLTQLLLKATCPGLPDIYQGTELWDLSLVDPDNRRPVDFEERKKLLANFVEQHSKDPSELWQQLMDNLLSGEGKLWLTKQVLQTRNQHPALFAQGDYIPLTVKGRHRKHIFAFARKHEQDWVITVVPLYPSLLTDEGSFSLRKVAWGKTRVKLPAFAPEQWENLLDGTCFETAGELLVGEIFQNAPYGLLKGKKQILERGAGMLMHVSSLPSAYGIGDLGIEAYRFVDFLAETGQSYWQVLPLNPISADSHYSPYSSHSAFAGNPLFISPQWLEERSMITVHNIKSKNKNSGVVDYVEAEEMRENLLKEVFGKFEAGGFPWLEQRFQDFCDAEKHWLDDYALFEVLKHQYGEKPWNEWPEHVRDRNGQEIGKVRRLAAHEIKEVQFAQFLFELQWQELKAYANGKGIQIFGDVPIYLAYDSADVWANPELFKLSETKQMEAVAGVPPDYFNEEGQLWNMPIYDWERNKRGRFAWWIKRIGRNLNLFDQIRLDHFRGFSAYWEVPGGEDTAINGKWIEGPGQVFFDALKRAFPTMPFIAEDLGDIDEAVYQLRDNNGLPGMHVLQFAFGDNLSKSVHAPHYHRPNGIVYTGTHDNNTVKGWYKTEVDSEIKKRIERYTGSSFKRSTCHMEMVRMAYASSANIAIIPLQDWLGEGAEGRMNIPSTTGGNWLWRAERTYLSSRLKKKIKETVALYGRK